MSQCMSFWDIPGMKAGVLTGDVAWNLLKFAKDKGFAIPAFNCTTSSSVNSVLEAGMKMGRPVIIQFSESDSAFFAGNALSNEKKGAAILGAVAGAHYTRNIAPAYGIPCLVHSDRCTKKLLPWIDGMLDADELHFKAYGEPLFSSHMLDLSEETLNENVQTCARHFKRMASMNQILETEVGITGGVEDGVDNSGVCKSKLYATFGDVELVWNTLSPISEKFTIAATFGNVSGVYKPGNVNLKPEVLSEFQKTMGAKLKCEKPFFFVFHGGSGSEKKDIDHAVSCGVVKLNIDTDTQWAYWEGILKFYKAKSGYLQAQLGNPEGPDKPNKSYFDPRKWIREAEVGMRDRVKESSTASRNVHSRDDGSCHIFQDCSWLTEMQKAALAGTAKSLSAPGKGFLASDESAGPWLRAGHVDAAKIPDTAENRAAYRSMLYKTDGLSKYISGVILHWETLFQSDADGAKMVDLITKNGMIPGIKLDKGYDKKGIEATDKGPLGHPETWCKGLDDLEKRCAEAYAAGARFAKWRNVLQIDPQTGLPSELAITLCVHNLAQYAAICQRQGIVPIVEPEIVPNGTHSIEVCAAATERVLVAQFAALKLHGVYLEGAVLKPNMVKNGLSGPKATTAQVATATVTALLRSVPAANPGIFFLSGETALDEDNEETATVNLNEMNKRSPKLPWSLSFSYGKALQKTCIVTWMGLKQNVPKAQAVLLARAKANSEATQGKYTPGSCPSIGAAGNVEMQGGAY